MDLSDQVCSLELAEKLKELGVKQESLFKYCGMESKICNKYEEWWCDPEEQFEKYSAFTASELLELLPTYINPSWMEIIKGCSLMEAKPKYCIRYYNADIIGEPDETLSNACAKMLIYLLENNLLHIKS